uniref:Uncharacterized protein n=1 Tax=Rhizophagus irregularis (strain DAOM 181602 / DAOM 197198 / MUCL 43194) TaxID=747089 RepID=U9UJM2_RHIID
MSSSKAPADANLSAPSLYLILEWALTFFNMQFIESVKMVQLLLKGSVIISVKIPIASLFVDDGKETVDPSKQV